MFRRMIPVIATSIGLLIVAACTQGTAPVAPTADTHAADSAGVRAAAEKWQAAIGARSIDAILSYYTEDGWQLAQNGPIARNADERRAFWQAISALPVASDIVNVADRVEVAHSGELAVQYGEFRQIISDKTGASTSVPQKFITTWRKQQDGSWKVTASMASVKN
jgi:ketosteroid isomerase-like protein